MSAELVRSDHDRDPVVSELLEKNDEFRKLFKDHRSLDEQLEEMDRRPYLTPEEQVERKRLQVMKLHRKDRMAEILRHHAVR
ncbi:MAG TPA: YdcH family protein [Bdellovibrionota bacterium]|nr:YdcH family protein [Bdellovibrionota bacterium]